MISDFDDAVRAIEKSLACAEAATTMRVASGDSETWIKHELATKDDFIAMEERLSTHASYWRDDDQDSFTAYRNGG